KKIATSAPVVRLLGNDKVMRVATGVMDARTRVRAAADLAAEAWSVLLNGHTLPTIDPALEGGAAVREARTNGAARNGAPLAGATSAERESGNGRSALSAEPRRTLRTVTTHAAEGDQQQLAQQMSARTSLSKIGGRDVFEKCFKFKTADSARAMGVYPFFRPLDFNNGPEAQLEGRKGIMLGSNNYLGLTTHPRVREAAKPAIEKYSTS